MKLSQTGVEWSWALPIMANIFDTKTWKSSTGYTCCDSCYWDCILEFVMSFFSNGQQFLKLKHMKNLALVTLAVAPVSVAAHIAELWWIENNISTEETWTFDVHKQAIRDVIIIQLKNLGKSFDVHKCLCMPYNSRNLGLLMCASVYGCHTQLCSSLFVSPPTCGWVVIIQLKKVCSAYIQWSQRFCQNSHTNTWISPSCPRLGIGAMLMVRNFYLTLIDSFFHFVLNTVIKSSPSFTVLYNTSVSSRDPDNFRSYRVCTLCQAPQVLSWVLSESPALLSYSDHSFAHKICQDDAGLSVRVSVSSLWLWSPTWTSSKPFFYWNHTILVQKVSPVLQHRFGSDCHSSDSRPVNHSLL